MSTKKIADTTTSRPWQHMIRVLAQQVPRSTLSLSTYGVIVNQGKVTLIKHSQLGWMLPGGKVKNESVEQSFQTVVNQQTGLVVESSKYFGYSLLNQGLTLLNSNVTLYFFAEAGELAASQLSDDVVELASVSAEEANYLFRESAAEIGVKHNHHEALLTCQRLGLLTNRREQLSSTFVVPIKSADEYKLNISRSFSSLYRRVELLDKGNGKKPYFEHEGKKIFLSVSEG